jgi:cell division protein FtsB|tara:strand:+ start:245 stop:460 length:216 start_codon:yes stop_codon:yes gene_type:complete
MARKSIVEATSQIMGQKEINHLADDRGPNDLERRIDEQDKTISHLKHDNKTLAKEVSDLIEEKKRMLDNRS